MAEDTPHTTKAPPEASPRIRLDSWKEIAAYLKRDATTVRRWEKREGLPVHRQLHAFRDSVYAYPTEIDAWLQQRRNDPATNGAAETRGSAVSEGSGTTLWRQLWVPWTLAGTLAIAALLAGAWGFRRPEPREQVRFPFFPPADTRLGTLAVSPDGRSIAFTGTTHGVTRLWIRRLDSLTATSLPETDEAALPFWSPDSDAVGFFAAGKLWTVEAAGGTPQAIASAPRGRGGTWNRQGIIVFAPDVTGPLVSVAASGGSPEPVTILGPNERGHVWPEFLPDGRRFLYLADSVAPEYHHLSVGDLSSRRGKNLFRLTSSAVYARQGYLLFERDRQLIAQRFDTARLQLTGDPLTLAEDVVQQWGLDHKVDVSVSNTGLLAFRSLGGFDTDLVWRDRSEQLSRFAPAPAGYSDPVLSPDQSRVAVGVFHLQPSKRFGFGSANITSDVWLLDRSGAVTPFTSDPGAEFEPVWSPDGRRIAYSSNRRGTLDLYQKNADGSGEDELLYASARPKHALAWSPDARLLVFATVDEKTRFDLWLLPMTGERTPIPLLATGASERNAQISPDGRWFAYTSNQSGRSEVYVQRFPSPTDRWQISTDGGGDARWSADGRQLFYIADDRQLMAVPVQAGETFAHGPAASLFDTGMSPEWGTSRNHYDVTRDGRFLMMVPVADDRTFPFTMVVNWTTGLRPSNR